jgi:hypothetical protein
MLLYRRRKVTDYWLGKFKKEALPKLVEEFKPEKVILFGSRVKGTAREDSDIDIIITSPYFANVQFIKRMPLVIRKVPFAKHVDYICYTPDEYEKIKNESSLLMDVAENSIELIA